MFQAEIGPSRRDRVSLLPGAQAREDKMAAAAHRARRQDRDAGEAPQGRQGGEPVAGKTLGGMWEPCGSGMGQGLPGSCDLPTSARQTLAEPSVSQE